MSWLDRRRAKKSRPWSPREPLQFVSFNGELKRVGLDFGFDDADAISVLGWSDGNTYRVTAMKRAEPSANH